MQGHIVVDSTQSGGLGPRSYAYEYNILELPNSDALLPTLYFLVGIISKYGPKTTSNSIVKSN